MQLSEVESLFIKEGYRVRKILDDHNLSYFNFTLNIKGRTASGDVKFEASLSNSEYGSGEVKGNSVDAVVEELLRRNGYEKKHATLCLPSTQPTTTEFGDRVILNLEDDKKSDDVDITF